MPNSLNIQNKQKPHLPNIVTGDDSESLSMNPRQNTEEKVAGHKSSAPGHAKWCKFIYLFILLTYLSIHLPVYLWVYLSLYLFHLFIHSFTHL